MSLGECVAVVGSRGYHPLSDVEAFVASLPVGTVLVSGTWPGRDPMDDRVDERAVRTAWRLGLAAIVHPALWRGALGRDAYNGGAGKARNSLIVRDADRLVAFYDGESDGTADSIRKAERKGIPVDVRRMR